LTDSNHSNSEHQDDGSLSFKSADKVYEFMLDVI